MDSPVFTINEFYSISMYTDPYAPTVPKTDLTDVLTSCYEFRFFFHKGYSRRYASYNFNHCNLPWRSIAFPCKGGRR